MSAAVSPQQQLVDEVVFRGGLVVRMYRWTAGPYVGRQIEDSPLGWPELNHQHLNIGVHTDHEFWVVGGGAEVKYGRGFLTGIYPNLEPDHVRALNYDVEQIGNPAWLHPWTRGRGWHASAKDHGGQFNTYYYLTGMCIALLIPGTGSNEMVDGPITGIGPDPLAYAEQDLGKVADDPRVGGYAVLPEDYLVIGGGARARWLSVDPGLLLTASHPFEDNAWFAEAKEHHEPSDGSIHVWAVGIHKDFLHDMDLVRDAVPPVTKAGKPLPVNVKISYKVPPGKQGLIVSGGAKASTKHANSPGLVLQAIYPLRSPKTEQDAAPGSLAPSGHMGAPTSAKIASTWRTWYALADQHLDPESEGTLTAYAIGLRDA